MGETCVCGDVMDEHEIGPGGPAECLVEDCGCVHFEWDGAEED